DFQEPAAYTLHMVVAPTKRNERFEWFLEKATEIGVTQITPLICAHSERQKIKLKRFNRVLQSAMKQSLQYYLPQLNAPQTFSEYMAQDFTGQHFMAHCEDHKKTLLRDVVRPKNHIT